MRKCTGNRKTAYGEYPQGKVDSSPSLAYSSWKADMQCRNPKCDICFLVPIALIITTSVVICLEMTASNT